MKLTHESFCSYWLRAASVLAILFFATTGYSQTWYNTYGIGSAGVNEAGHGSCADASGNVYYIGNFAGSSDFNPGAGVTTLVPTGSSDVFVTKYNAAGTFQWAVRCGGGGADNGNAICTDGTNLYITGKIQTNATAASFGSFTLTPAGGADVFCAKLNCSNGVFTWAVRNGGTANEEGQGICLDASGNPYVTGFYVSNPCTFGSTSLTLNGGAGTDVFIAKYNAANGSVTWANGGGSAAGTDNTNSSAICFVPATNELVVTGAYKTGAATFGTFTLPSPGTTNDIFMLELNATTGAFTNAFGMGNTAVSDDEGLGAVYDSFTGDVYVCGDFNSTITFPGVGSLSSGAGTSPYVARYSAATGSFVWATRGNGNSGNKNKAWGICTDGNGTVAITGQFRNNLTFGTTILIQSNGAFDDVFVANVSVATGTVLWAVQCSGNNSTLGDIGRSVSSGSNRFYATGQFATSCTFGSTTMTSNGNVDIFFSTVLGPLTSTQSQINLTCNAVCGGSATVVPNGGLSPYTYSWAPSGGTAATASSLCAGIYTCTITDAANNVITKTFTITQPSAIIAPVTSQTNVSCNGGSNGAATIAASGGTGSLSYSWAPSGGTAATATGLSAGTYTCTTSDASGCTQTTTVTITEPVAISVSLVSQTNVTCNGGNTGNATMSATGGTGTFTYTWAPSGGSAAAASGLSAGTYTCTATDASGCTQIAMVTITQPSAISIVTSSTQESCTGNDGTASATPSGGTSPYTYLWSNAQTTAAITNLVTGTYTCTVTDANGCSTNATRFVAHQVCNSTQLTSAFCGVTLTSLAQQIYCNPVAGATNYRYNFACAAQNFNLAFNRNASFTNFSLLNNASGIQYNRTYDVRVAAYVGGVWMPWGPVCTVTTPATIPLTQLIAANCGSTVSSLSSAINCVAVPGATNYRYNFVCSAQGYNLSFQRGNANTDFTLTSATGLQYNRTYDVKVSAFVDGVWQPWGNVCQVSTSGIPATNLTTAWCGASVASFTTLVYCEAVGGATDYQWKIENPATGYISAMTRGNGNPNWALSWNTGITTNTTYNVSVRAKVSGVWGTYGAMCTLTTGTSAMTGDQAEVPSEVRFSNPEVFATPAISLEAYPNPFSDKITITTSGDIREVAVYNSLGELVRKVEITSGQTEIYLGDLPAGIYFLVAESADGKITRKLIRE
jgi:hypothetical protein